MVNKKIKLIGMIAVLSIFALAVINVPIYTQEETDNDGMKTGISFDNYVDVAYKPANSDTWTYLVKGKHNLLVDNGKTYIETQIGNGSAIASNSTIYLSLSDAGTAPAASWVQLPNEISTNGLARTSGTYQHIAVGQWNFTNTWTATGAQTVQLAGLNYAAGNSSGNLFAALQFTQASLAANDQIRVNWSITLS